MPPASRRASFPEIHDRSVAESINSGWTKVKLSKPDGIGDPAPLTNINARYDFPQLLFLEGGSFGKFYLHVLIHHRNNPQMVWKKQSIVIFLLSMSQQATNTCCWLCTVTLEKIHASPESRISFFAALGCAHYLSIL